MSTVSTHVPLLAITGYLTYSTQIISSIFYYLSFTNFFVTIKVWTCISLFNIFYETVFNSNYKFPNFHKIYISKYYEISTLYLKNNIGALILIPSFVYTLYYKSINNLWFNCVMCIYIYNIFKKKVLIQESYW